MNSYYSWLDALKSLDFEKNIEDYNALFSKDKAKQLFLERIKAPYEKYLSVVSEKNKLMDE